MKTQDAIQFFGSQENLRTVLKIKSRQTIRSWGDFPPDGRQYQIEVVTNGALRAERPITNISAERPIINVSTERPITNIGAERPVSKRTAERRVNGNIIWFERRAVSPISCEGFGS
jgi:hypothetical protein